MKELTSRQREILQFISDYIARQHAKNNIITVPSAIKTIKDGKIITLKE